MENIKFKCQVCGRTFRRKCDLTHHVKYGKHSNCLECGKIISGNNKFCNSSCSATYNNHLRQVSDEQKLKTSKSLHSYYKEHPHSYKEHSKPLKQKLSIRKRLYCSQCGHEISRGNKSKLCRSCLCKSETFKLKCQKAGQSSVAAQKETRRSKNEIFFFNLIKTYFSDAVPNEQLFNGWDADVVIPSLKIAILWNGRWHYENICGQLKQVQNRDKIKYSEIVKAGYMPYIITDLGKFSKKKCNFELNRFLEFIRLI